LSAVATPLEPKAYITETYLRNGDAIQDSHHAVKYEEGKGSALEQLSARGQQGIGKSTAGPMLAILLAGLVGVVIAILVARKFRNGAKR
jgi:hypothetical protein